MSRTGQRVVLIVPNFFGYEKKIKDAIKQYGNDCLVLDERIGNSFWAKFLTRIRLLQRITPVMRRHMARISAELGVYHPDIILLINPETLGSREIASIREANPQARVVLYMWDSSSKKPVNESLAAVVHTAYSFDIVDCNRILGWYHVPLFHSHTSSARRDDPGDSIKEHDFSFIGTARPRRVAILAKIGRIMKKESRPFFFYLLAKSPVHYVYYLMLAKYCGYTGIISRSNIDYNTYTEISRRSRCVIDIEQCDQAGLTIRTMEAVFSGVPLLTTNTHIKQYDFFSKTAVYIWDEADEWLPDGDEIQGENRDNHEYFTQYSINNWVRVLLDEETPDYTVNS